MYGSSSSGATVQVLSCHFSVKKTSKTTHQYVTINNVSIDWLIDYEGATARNKCLVSDFSMSWMHERMLWMYSVVSNNRMMKLRVGSLWLNINTVRWFYNVVDLPAVLTWYGLHLRCDPLYCATLYLLAISAIPAIYHHVHKSNLGLLGYKIHSPISQLQLIDKDKIRVGVGNLFKWVAEELC